jgi:hypothetical protein
MHVFSKRFKHNQMNYNLKNFIEQLVGLFPYPLKFRIRDLKTYIDMLKHNSSLF